MAEIKCPQCKGDKFSVLGVGQYKCAYCGNVFTVEQPAPQQNETQQQVIVVPTPQSQPQGPKMMKVNDKSRITAALLAFLLGGIGAHHFYLGNIGLGIVYLLFCWTLIPPTIAFIEFIVYLCMSDERFNQKYNMRYIY